MKRKIIYGMFALAVLGLLMLSGCNEKPQNNTCEIDAGANQFCKDNGYDNGASNFYIYDHQTGDPNSVQVYVTCDDSSKFGTIDAQYQWYAHSKTK